MPSPTPGTSATTSTPARCSTSREPMPDRSRIVGLPKEPAERMTSLRAVTVLGARSVWSACQVASGTTSTPLAFFPSLDSENSTRTTRVWTRTCKFGCLPSWRRGWRYACAASWRLPDWSIHRCHRRWKPLLELRFCRSTISGYPVADAAATKSSSTALLTKVPDET